MSSLPATPHHAKPRAIGLIRVSEVKGREGERFSSPKDQRRDRISDEAERRGFELVDVIPELDVSGGAPLELRPFGKAIERVERGEVQAIIFAYRDRADQVQSTEAHRGHRADRRRRRRAHCRRIGTHPYVRRQVGRGYDGQLHGRVAAPRHQGEVGRRPGERCGERPGVVGARAARIRPSRRQAGRQRGRGPDCQASVRDAGRAQVADAGPPDVEGARRRPDQPRRAAAPRLARLSRRDPLRQAAQPERPRRDRRPRAVRPGASGWSCRAVGAGRARIDSSPAWAYCGAGRADTRSCP